MILNFSILFFVTLAFGKPAGNYRGIGFTDYKIRMKKHNDDSSSKGYLEQCGRVKFPNAQLGSVNVLAFLDSSWPYSHRQAIMLKMLNERLRKSGLLDTHFFVVNVNPRTASTRTETMEDDIEREAWLGVSPEEIEGLSKIDKTLDSLARSTFPDIKIIQDSEELGIWKKFGGSRDQVLVIDRCGKLAYQVIVPWSILHFPYVKAAILSTHKDEPCGYCVIVDETTSQYEQINNLENLLEMNTIANHNNIVTLSDIDEYSGSLTDDNVDKQSHEAYGNDEATTTQRTDSSVSMLRLNFFSSPDMTITPYSTARNLIGDENYNDLTSLPSTKKYEETDLLPAHSIVDSKDSGIKEDTSTEVMMSEFSGELKMATASLNSMDLDDAKDTNPAVTTTNIYESTSLSTIDNIIDDTTETILNIKTAGIRHFDEENVTLKMADATIVTFTDFIDFDAKNENLDTTNNDEATSTSNYDNNSETTIKDISQSEESRKIDDAGNIEDVDPSESRENYASLSSYMPIRIIMHAPHFHADVDSTRMHEYVVLKTGISMKHGHLGSNDATRLYSGPQDQNEGMSNLTIREIETRQWPMKNIIYNRDESTGLFGEVADYWRDIGSLENYEDADGAAERPDNNDERIYESAVDEKLWKQRPASKVNDEKLPNDEEIVDATTIPYDGVDFRGKISTTEGLQADVANERVTEIQLTKEIEEFNDEEEEMRNKLIAHYSKLLPWIYYVLDK